MMMKKMMTMKTVNLYAPHQYIVKNTEVNGFVNQVELSLDDIRKLIGAGVKVSEIVKGKEIVLSFTNYTQDFKSYNTIEVKEKPESVIVEEDTSDKIIKEEKEIPYKQKFVKNKK